MRLPNKVTIAGYDFKIIKSKGKGASFDLDKLEITVGKDSTNNVFNNFIHEILEVLLVLRGYRYTYYNAPTNDKLVFVMNHAEFSNVCDDFSNILQKLICR